MKIEPQSLVTLKKLMSWIISSVVFTKENFRIRKPTLPLSPEMSEININIEAVRWLMKNLGLLKQVVQIMYSLDF